MNPLPEIAGLRSILPRLRALPAGATTETQRNRWSRMLGELPEIPTKTENGQRWLLPAETYSRERNIENPELYAVWPYSLYGVGKPDLDVALATYDRRKHKGTGGWFQNAIQAACLGRAEEAAEMVASNFASHHPGSRFPAFFGPNYDWVPDQDHGAVAMIALQKMLLQWDGDRILLLPAWPKKWDVSFKLHAPKNTIVEGFFEGGSLRSLRVTPPSARKTWCGSSRSDRRGGAPPARPRFSPNARPAAASVGPLSRGRAPLSGWRGPSAIQRSRRHDFATAIPTKGEPTFRVPLERLRDVDSRRSGPRPLPPFPYFMIAVAVNLTLIAIATVWKLNEAKKDASPTSIA